MITTDGARTNQEPKRASGGRRLIELPPRGITALLNHATGTTLHDALTRLSEKPNCKDYLRVAALRIKCLLEEMREKGAPASGIQRNNFRETLVRILSNSEIHEEIKKMILKIPAEDLIESSVECDGLFDDNYNALDINISLGVDGIPTYFNTVDGCLLHYGGYKQKHEKCIGEYGKDSYPGRLCKAIAAASVKMIKEVIEQNPEKMIYTNLYKLFSTDPTYNGFLESINNSLLNSAKVIESPWHICHLLRLGLNKAFPQDINSIIAKRIAEGEFSIESCCNIVFGCRGRDLPQEIKSAMYDYFSKKAIKAIIFRATCTEELQKAMDGIIDRDDLKRSATQNLEHAARSLYRKVNRAAGSPQLPDEHNHLISQNNS